MSFASAAPVADNVILALSAYHGLAPAGTALLRYRLEGVSKEEIYVLLTLQAEGSNYLLLDGLVDFLAFTTPVACRENLFSKGLLLTS